jgi:hypothetical protein
MCQRDGDVGGEIGTEEHFSATAKRVTRAKSYVKGGVGAPILVFVEDGMDTTIFFDN